MPIGVLLIKLSINATEPADCDDILTAVLQLMIEIDLKVQPSRSHINAVATLLKVRFRIVNCWFAN
jgi:hypothetical protein